MHQEPPADAEVEGWLKTLGVQTLCQWDVLVFLYRHQTSLAGADHLARLSGYPTERVVAALDVLDSLGLVKRSRVSQGARLYQFTAPSGPQRGEAFDRLLALAQNRAGRLLLAKRLRRGGRTPEGGLLAARRLLDEARRSPRAAREHEGRRETWLKAI
jgi:hypothetical protein